MLRTTLMILTALFTLTGASLPEQGPLPQKRDTGEIAVPAEKPDDQPATDGAGREDQTSKPNTEDRNKVEPAQSTPEDTPVPEKKPSVEEKPVPETKPAEDKTQPDKASDEVKPATEEKAPPIEEPKPVVEKEDPAAYAACLVELKASGAVFKEDKAIDDGEGCGIDRPLTVSSVGAGIKLEPEGQMRCQTALALGNWAEKSAEPAAQTAFGEKTKLVTIGQASTYVCRLRNNAETGKISEHARGNAVDIATLQFENAPAVEMKPRLEDATMTGAFQRAVTASACLYFSTVLSPGSDAAHETHLHLDVLKRKGDYRYCR